MSRILVSKTVTNAVLTGTALIALSSSPLLTQNPSKESTPGSEVVFF